jgi:hypothetical protein
LYGIAFYVLCWRHARRLSESFRNGLRPAIGAPTKEVRRAEKAVFMLLESLEQLRIERMGQSPLTPAQ